MLKGKFHEKFHSLKVCRAAKTSSLAGTGQGRGAMAGWAAVCLSKIAGNDVRSFHNHEEGPTWTEVRE